MKKTLFFMLFFPLLAHAQPFLDVASVYYQYSSADEPGSKNPVYTDLASVSLTLPLQMDSDYIVINPVYENFKMTFPLTYKDRAYHITYLPLTWLHQWNHTWKTAFVVIPRFHWPEYALDLRLKDMQYGAAILNSYQQKETLKFKFGLYYNSEFFGPFFMPLLGIDWNINPRLNLFGVLPGSMNLEYKVNKAMHAGVLFRSITNSYRTSDNYFIRVNDNHLKLFLDFYISPKNVVGVEAGHTLFRNYKSGHRSGNTREYEPMNVTDGFLFRISYAFRFRTDASH